MSTTTYVFVSVCIFLDLTEYFGDSSSENNFFYFSRKKVVGVH